MIKILKFGGTSVGTPEAIRKSVKIVLQDKKNKNYPIVIVSAFSGVTNQLIMITEKALAGESRYKIILKDLEQRHINAVKVLVKPEWMETVLKKVRVVLKELENILNKIVLTKDSSKKTLDEIMSFGERLSAYIISETFKSEGINVEFLDSRPLIKTNNFFSNAEVLYALTNKNIREYFKNCKSIQIVTGFLASTEKNETTTLGRGGSDYTASILGAALQAEVIEIWTDVSGMMTADPRKVKDAFVIKNITYEEAFEMSYFGAKVIYPPTIHPAFEQNIPIVIKNTFRPEDKGTLISSKEFKSNFLIKGITSIDDISILRLKGVSFVGVPGTADRLFRCLSKAKINIVLIIQSSSEHSICIAILPKNISRAKEIIETEFKSEIESNGIDKIITEENLSVVTVVGKDMRHKPGVAGRLFGILGKQSINVIAIAQGSSEINISVVINNKDLNKALNLIHGVFFEESKKLNIFMVGVGKIGANLLLKFNEQKSFLKKNNALELQLIGLANSQKMIFNEEGLNISKWENAIEESEQVMNIKDFIFRMNELDLPDSVFVDCTSSDEISLMYGDILSKGISIVTPNKKANSGRLSYYKKLHEIAFKKHVAFLYETNVGAGLPVIGILNDLFSTGDKIIKIEAVLSGTLSYIFNNFKGNKSFSSLLREAWNLGYTEPDPRDDLNGTDVARKILILGREIGLPLEFKDIKIKNFLSNSCQSAKTVDDFFIELKKMDKIFEKLKTSVFKNNQSLKYIATLEKGKIQIGLKTINAQHPLADLADSDNIISFTTERYKKTPLVVRGPGAGVEVTTAGVFADIIRLAYRF